MTLEAKRATSPSVIFEVGKRIKIKPPLKKGEDFPLGLDVGQLKNAVAELSQGEVLLLEGTTIELECVDVQKKVKTIIARDITDIVEEQRKNYHILENMEDGVCEIGPDGKFVYVNQALANILGFEDTSELIGKEFTDFIKDEGDKKERKNGMKSRGATEKSQYEQEIVTKSGKKILWVMAISYGEGSFSIIRDITKQKEHEAKLNELIEELRTAKERAEEADKSKSIFLANMSHELKTPLNGIIGFSDFITVQLDTLLEDKEELLKHITTIHNQGLNLDKLIDDILDFSKIESGQVRIELESIPVLSALRDSVSMINHSGINDVKESIEIKFSDSDEAFMKVSNIEADPLRFSQIMINLLTNAVKFTEEGSITIGCKEIIKKEKEYIQFSVTDTGKGVDPKLGDDIFDRFTKGDEKKTLFIGTGLGLAITKGLVKAMGGRIWYETEQGKGTTFHFTIPCSEEGVKTIVPEKEKPKEKKETYDWKEKAILLVEDEFVNMHLLKETIGKTGAKIFSAGNGLEAVETVKNNPNIDIVLMDVKMPEMDGYQATKKIKALYPELPIIIQSAFAEKKDKKDAKESGADDYVTKPIMFDELFKVMQKYLEKKK